MKIALVTDSTANLSAAEIEKYNIKVIPIPIYIDDKEYLEGINITSEELFESQRSGSSFPTTSQPKMGDLITTFDNFKDEGYEAIIYICLSSGISGSYSTLMGGSRKATRTTTCTRLTHKLLFACRVTKFWQQLR